jgi:phytoene synthase
LCDVKEDLLQLDRLYLPLSLLEKHGLCRDDIAKMAEGRQALSDAYRACLREIAERAQEHYELAFEAIPCLPLAFQRPVAIAADVYRGIQEILRERNYNNLSERIFVPTPQKFFLAIQALYKLRLARRTTPTPRLAS